MRSTVAPAQAVSDANGPHQLVRLCAAGSLAYCSYQMCRAPLLPLFARDLGADAPMVGFVVAASTLTGIVLKLPAGAWSDVLGRRPLLVAGGLVFAVMPFTYLGVASLGALVALRFAHGSATAIFGPVASASLSDIAPPRRRATWLSTYSTVQGAGQALAEGRTGDHPLSARHRKAPRRTGGRRRARGSLHAIHLPAALVRSVADGRPGRASADDTGLEPGAGARNARHHPRNLSQPRMATVTATHASERLLCRHWPTPRANNL